MGEHKRSNLSSSVSVSVWMLPLILCAAWPYPSAAARISSYGNLSAPSAADVQQTKAGQQSSRRINQSGIQEADCGRHTPEITSAAGPSESQRARDQAESTQGGTTTPDGMQGMQDHGGMEMHTSSFMEEILHHGTAGTSAEPNSTPHPMLMTMKHNWMLMLHGVGFL